MAATEIRLTGKGLGPTDSLVSVEVVDEDGNIETIDGFLTSVTTISGPDARAVWQATIRPRSAYLIGLR